MEGTWLLYVRRMERSVPGQLNSTWIGPVEKDQFPVPIDFSNRPGLHDLWRSWTDTGYRVDGPISGVLADAIEECSWPEEVREAVAVLCHRLCTRFLTPPDCR